MAQPPDLDAVDRILLHEGAAALAGAQMVAVVDDESGGLTAGALELSAAPMRVYGDSAAGRARVAQGLPPSDRWQSMDDLEATTSGADVVLLRLPKSLEALDEIAGWAAARGMAGLTLFAGGRVKHLSRGMNEVLGRSFGDVRASLGQQKSRVLIASTPRPNTTPPQSRTGRHDDLGVTLSAHGGTFAGASVDRGSRFLISFFNHLPRAEHVVDLGSGSGLLGVLVALQQPQAHITAVDDSAAAVRSTASTAELNGVSERLEVHHADRLVHIEEGSIDLVVCNPPFHRGAARDSTAAYAMFADARRVLGPGGELWVVYNSHLPYLNALRNTVGRTTIVGQNPGYTVTRSCRSER